MAKGYPPLPGDYIMLEDVAKILTDLGYSPGAGGGLPLKNISNSTVADLDANGNIKLEGRKGDQSAGSTVEFTETDALPMVAVNTDGDAGRTIFVGSVDPADSYTVADGDVWIEPSA